MSVINQVLNQLEKRGANTAADQPMVRAVQPPMRNLTLPLIGIVLVLIAGIAAWQWLSLHETVIVPGNIASKATLSPVPLEVEKLSAQKQSAAAPAPEVLAMVPPVEPLAPASRLSLELSSPPLSAIQPGSGLSLEGNDSHPEANSAGATNPKAARPKTAKQRTVKPGKGMQAPPPHPEPAAKVAERAPADAMPMKQISVAQRADAEFRRAATLMQQGRIDDAIAGYEAALRQDAGHESARQALVALLLDGKRNEDAEKVLLDGVKYNPKNTGFTMLLARLQMERGALEQATATLEVSLPFADTQTDYRAFLAALLQRQNRNEEAIAQYQIVLQHAPDNGIWQMGYGISLQALQRNVEARDAFKRALDTHKLSPELQAFVQQRLKGL